jgi:hypothetical protein
MNLNLEMLNYGIDRINFVDDMITVKPRKLFHCEVVKAEMPNTARILVYSNYNFFFVIKFSKNIYLEMRFMFRIRRRRVHQLSWARKGNIVCLV